MAGRWALLPRRGRPPDSTPGSLAMRKSFAEFLVLILLDPKMVWSSWKIRILMARVQESNGTLVPALLIVGDHMGSLMQLQLFILVPDAGLSKVTRFKKCNHDQLERDWGKGPMAATISYYG